MNTGEGLDQAGFPGSVVSKQAPNLAGADIHRDVFESDDVPEILGDASGFQERCVVRHHLASDARLRMKLLNSTATSSVTPTNTWNQSVLTPVKKIPCCTMPKMSAPKNVGRSRVQDLDGREQRSGEGGTHEERNLHPVYRYAHVARGYRIAARPEDPVPEHGPLQDPGS